MPISDYHVVGDANSARNPSGQTTIVIQTPDKANQLSYNNTSSGLSATNVQSAIDEVVENISEDTTVTTSTDSTPYLYRQSKAIGDREYLEYIDGGSLGWNQLVQNGNFADTSGWVSEGNGSMSVSNNEATITVLDTSQACLYYTTINAIKDHKYLLIADIKASQGYGRTSWWGTNLAIKQMNGSYIRIESVINSTISNSALHVQIGVTDQSTPSTFNVKNVKTIDLTLALGSEIADYVYSLEQAEAGSGIAWLKEQGLFINDYYAYDAGSIKSVNVSGHKMVGFNQWDEKWELGTFDIDGNEMSANDRIRSKNYILCEPNTTYYYRGTQYAYFVFYDKLKNFVAGSYVAKAPNTTIQTPNNAHYIRFRVAPGYGTTYNHDICINISDTTKNGTYEPYEEHTYPISSTDLLGIPKLTSDNKLGFDGDRYNANGRGDRKYSIVDLGRLPWTYTGSGDNMYFRAEFPNNIPQSFYKTNDNQVRYICSNYKSIKPSLTIDIANGEIARTVNPNSIFFIKDSNYSDAATFKTALQNSNAQLVYERATHTTETLAPIINPQICSPYGTEEFISDSPVPVPHSTEYYKTPDWMDVEPLKSERKNNDSNTLKVAELEHTRPELKKIDVSGTTDSQGQKSLISKLVIPIAFIESSSNYCVVDFFKSGNEIAGLFRTANNNAIMANTSFSGTLYYYEL